MRRFVFFGAVALFMVASGFTALRLTAGGSATDGPVQAVSHPSPDLLLTATLDHGRVGPNSLLQLQVELKNVGEKPVPLPASGRCQPPLQVTMKDSQGRVVWAQPLPMCAEQFPPRQQLLYPGQSLQGSFCWELGRSIPGQCALLQLPAGSYRVSGSFYAQGLPEVPFHIS